MAGGRWFRKINRWKKIPPPPPHPSMTLQENPPPLPSKFSKNAFRLLLWSHNNYNKCKNVNVYVYSLISHRVQQTSQFTPLVLELSLVRSHLLWGEFSAFSAAIAIHNSPLFVPPGTHHCWVDRGGMI